jgi:hypothetical protein
MQVTAASLEKIESKNLRFKWVDFAGPKTELSDSGIALTLPQKIGTSVWQAASATMNSARIGSSGQSYGPYRVEAQRGADGTRVHIGFDPSGALVASGEVQYEDNGSKTLTLDIARSHLNTLGVRNGFGLVPTNTAFELHAKLRAPADKKISYTLELTADLPDFAASGELTAYRWTATTETASHVPSTLLKRGSVLVPFELAVSWTNSFKLLATSPKGDARIRLDSQTIALGDLCVRGKTLCEPSKVP